jgi:hypothetical protein
LLAEGERLITEAERGHGIPPGVVTFSLDDTRAAVENLRLDERMWHGSMTAEQRTEMLKTIFDVQES